MRRDRRRKLHFSKIYTFKCLRHGFKEDHSQIGGRGFSRVVFCNEPEGFEAALYNYADNSVRSTKYTLTTFLPKSLFEQFRRVANFYFLVTGVLAFTALAPYTAVSAIVPLIIVVGATMVKEGIEDWRRKMQVIYSNSYPFYFFILQSKFLLLFFLAHCHRIKRIQSCSLYHDFDSQYPFCLRFFFITCMFTSLEVSKSSRDACIYEILSFFFLTYRSVLL